MDSEEQPLLRNYVVDSRRGWKIRCDANNWIKLYELAVTVFGDDPADVGHDQIVVYKTGEMLDGQELFLQHRYYMYLKENEEYTYDPDFDVENMKYYAPRRRQPKPPLVPATEEMVAIFRELLEEHNYMNDRAWEGYDDETLTNIVSIDVEDMGRKLGVPENEVEQKIGDIAMRAIHHVTNLLIRKSREGGVLW